MRYPAVLAAAVESEVELSWSSSLFSGIHRPSALRRPVYVLLLQRLQQVTPGHCFKRWTLTALVPLQRHPALHAVAAETDVDDPLAQLEDRERTGTPSGPGAKKKGEGEGSGDEAEADVTMDPGEEEDDEDNDDYYQASAALLRPDD